LVEVAADLSDGAIILLDLDGFKNANDTMGHYAGDLLLQAAANRLTDLLPKGSFAGRWGGDEFVVFVASKNIRKT
jgi:diguanylate cyclase (GGDEF)-like protein